MVGSMKPIFKGMYRPTWEEMAATVDTAESAYFRCSCGRVLSGHGDGTVTPTERVREHWQAGHFDEPVYAEMMPE